MTDQPIPFPAERRQGVEALGLGYVYRQPALNLTLHFTYLRQGSEPSAEIRAETTLPGVSGHLVTGRVKLTGPRSKAEFAKALWDAWEVQPQKVWADQVELACQDVLERLRAGSPVHTIEGDFRAPPADRYLAAPFLPIGATTVLYGPGGAGKGYLACGLAVSLGLGQPFCGIATATTRVLYLDWEDTLEEFKRRVRAVADGMGVHPLGLLYRECRQPFDTMVEELAGLVAAERVGLVVIDSAEAAMGESEERSTAASRANRLFNHLRHLDTTTLVIDHITGDGLKSKELAGRPFDSVFKSFRARATWEVKKDQQTGAGYWHVGLYLTKTNRTAPLAPIGVEIDLATPGRVQFRRADVRQSDVLAAATSWQYRVDGVLAHGKHTHAELYAALGAETENDQGSVRKTVSRGVEKARYARAEEEGVTRFWKPAPEPSETETPI